MTSLSNLPKVPSNKFKKLSLRLSLLCTLSLVEGASFVSINAMENTAPNLSTSSTHETPILEDSSDDNSQEERIDIEQLTQELPKVMPPETEDIVIDISDETTIYSQLKETQRKELLSKIEDSNNCVYNYLICTNSCYRIISWPLKGIGIVLGAAGTILVTTDVLKFLNALGIDERMQNIIGGSGIALQILGLSFYGLGSKADATVMDRNKELSRGLGLSIGTNGEGGYEDNGTFNPSITNNPLMGEIFLNENEDDTANEEKLKKADIKTPQIPSKIKSSPKIKQASSTDSAENSLNDTSQIKPKNKIEETKDNVDNSTSMTPSIKNVKTEDPENEDKYTSSKMEKKMDKGASITSSSSHPANSDSKKLKRANAIKNSPHKE